MGVGRSGSTRLLPIFTIPLCGMTSSEAIGIARDPDRTLELSRRCSVYIPDRSWLMESLLDQYEASDLAAFHHESYSQLWAQVPFITVRSLRGFQTPLSA